MLHLKSLLHDYVTLFQNEPSNYQKSNSHFVIKVSKHSIMEFYSCFYSRNAKFTRHVSRSCCCVVVAKVVVDVAVY